MHGGDVLTLGRLAATPLFLWSFARALADPDLGVFPAAIFIFAAASDYFDGVLARRAGRASARGRVLDSSADIVFLLSAMAYACSAGLVPWWVPLSVAVSFAYYVVDSWLLTRGGQQRSLVGSRIGHLGGIANYVVVGVLTFNEGCGLHLLSPPVLSSIYALVPLYSSAAIVSRWSRMRGLGTV